MLLTVSCGSTTAENNQNKAQEQTIPPGDKVAYFASGCFWCAEAVFESVKGVEEAISGYSGGKSPNPTYRKVSSGSTDYAEAVKVIYDPMKISYKTLLTVFFDSQNPTTPNQQGPDRGTQYRSIAFYQNTTEKAAIEEYIDSLNKTKVYSQPIVTQVIPFERFWRAEDYHQNYEKNHPNEPYIQSVSIPRIERFKTKRPELLK